MGSEEIASIFGNRVRVRVMGILQERNSVLMINHSGLNDSNELWLPPGGGLEYGESVIDCLQREFLEETALNVKVDGFLMAGEFVNSPFHAIELFFRVSRTEGKLAIGKDSELEEYNMLSELKFMSEREFRIKENRKIHYLFRDISTFDDIFAGEGLFYFQNNP